jgi:type 2 lantibiotic biosynthesis protein LanM
MVRGVAVPVPESDRLWLAETPAALHRRFPAPGWLTAVRDAWPELAAGSDDPSCCCDGLPAAASGPVERKLARWVEPLVSAARRTLRTRIHALRGEFGSSAEVAENHPVLRPDHDQIHEMTVRVLVLELNVARERGRLCGADPRERFACFATGLRRSAFALDLLAGYPVLARELVVHLEQWTDTRFEFYRRLLADRADLAAAFDLDPSRGLDVEDLHFGLSDPHGGGRSVVLVRLSAGTVVYKPRPLAAELHFAQLLSWLADRGLDPAPRGMSVLDRGDYGWCAHVPYAPCADPAALSRFHRRHGAQLAVLHALRAHDIHLHNVICSGEHPVVVDAETLFHSPGAADPDRTETSPAEWALRESVLATLLLPQPSVDLDLCGLTGGRDPGERRAMSFADPGTDRMRLVRTTTPRPRGQNLPGPNGVPVEDVVDGFVDCYRLLVRERAALLADDGPVAAFGADRVRRVLRDTANYRTVLAECWHPDLLRDSLDREVFLTVLDGRGVVSGLPALTASEHVQLAQHDVPSFDIEVGRTDLTDESGVVVADYLRSSGLAAVRQRITGLSESDLADQVWLVRASLAEYSGVGSAGRPTAPAHADPVIEAEVVDAAMTVAERLRRSALPDPAGGGPQWLTLDTDGTGRWELGPLGLGLSAGVIGVAVFLTELEVALGETGFRPLVDDVVGELLDPDRLPPAEVLAEMCPSVYDGLGSVLYLILRRHELGQGGTAPLAGAEWLRPALAASVASTVDTDLATGLIGAAQGLLRLWHNDPEQGDLLETVSDALAASTEPPTHGFGRGYVLAALADVTGQERLARAAEAALLAERLTPSVGWPDGLAGRVLARAALCRLTTPSWWSVDPRIELASATEALIAAPEPDIDTLLGGRIGLAEALRTAAAVTGEDRTKATADRMISGVARRVRSDDWRTAAAGGIWSPGLLAGSTGIGYGLLQAARPDWVPSLLLIDRRTDWDEPT